VPEASFEESQAAGLPGARTSSAPLVVYDAVPVATADEFVSPKRRRRSVIVLALTVALTALLSFWIGSWATRRAPSSAADTKAQPAPVDEAEQAELAQPEASAARPAVSAEVARPAAEARASDAPSGAPVAESGASDAPAAASAPTNKPAAAPKSSPSPRPAKAGRQSGRYDPMGI
jgi:hypothetical protein